MCRHAEPLTEEQWQLFEDLCGIMCTIEEICSILRIKEYVLDDRIKKKFDCSLIDMHRVLCDTGKMSIRRSQMEIGKTNATMAIWLGKVYLGQRDTDGDDRDMNKCLGIIDHIKELKISDAKP
jgi:hypothetical protein